MKRCLGMSVVTLVVITLSDISHANIITWDVGVGCQVFDGVNEDTIEVNEIESPFAASHDAQWGSLRAEAEYDFAWNSTTGQFLVNTSQTAPNTSEYSFATCSGGIGLTSKLDLDISLNALYDYILPGSITEAVLEMTVGRIELPGPGFVVVWSETEGVLAGSGPLSGTLSIVDSIILPGGHLYYVSYAMTLYVDGGGNADLEPVFGDGVVNIQIAKVPEASAWLMICLVSVVLANRLPKRHAPRSTMPLKRSPSGA